MNHLSKEMWKGTCPHKVINAIPFSFLLHPLPLVLPYLLSLTLEDLGSRLEWHPCRKEGRAHGLESGAVVLLAPSGYGKRGPVTTLLNLTFF